MNMVNKCKKTDFHSGHLVLNCQGWKYESYIEGLKTNRKKKRQRGEKKKKGKSLLFQLFHVVTLPYEFRYPCNDPVVAVKMDLL